MDTVAMHYHIGRSGVSSLSPGDQIYPSFSGYSSKGVRLELLASICKRGKKETSAIFLPEVSLPALDGGVDRLYTKSFSFLVRLSLSLTDTGAVLVPPGSTTKTGWGCTRGRPDSIPT